MHSDLMMSIRTLLAHQDHPDRDALFAFLDNWHASDVLACLAPPGSLLQIVAALHVGWSWCLEGWERQIDKLVGLITDPRCPSPHRMIATWSDVPDAVGVLRDRTDTLIAWAQQQIHPAWYAALAILLGPSDAAARLLLQSPSSDTIGRTLRRWSMAISPDNPTAWQAIIDPDLRVALHQNANPSWAFPAWGRGEAVDSDIVLREIVDDLASGWSHDHPSIRRQIEWLEHHISPKPYIDELARVASIGDSDALAEAVCVHVVYDPLSIPWIARIVPWGRLHARIQTVIDETMQQVSDHWKRMWACALGQAPLVPDTIIDTFLLMWRIDPERWKALDSKLRGSLVARRPLPFHCYGWGVHPDLVAGKDCPDGRTVRFWNPDVPPSDLLAWVYADRLRAQSTLQESRILIDLLMTLPPDRRTRFEQIIEWRLGGRPQPTAQPPWEWTTWASLPAADRQRRLRARLRALWGNRTTPPAYRVWMARSHPLDTVAVMIRALLDSKRAPRILAALLAQIPALRVHMPNPKPHLPFPDDLKDAHRAQIDPLFFDLNRRAYAAWCLWFLDHRVSVGADLIALHPDVAVTLAPVLTNEQRADVAASPAAQGWDSMTVIHWAAACASAEEPTMIPIQRRIR